MKNHNNWHDEHLEKLSFGSKLADKVAASMGSWRFIIIQTFFVVIWMSLNVAGFCYHWDLYPFMGTSKNSIFQV